MNIAELMHGLKGGKLSDLYPIKDITEENAEELKSQGYNIVLTAKQYAEKFPWLPMDKAYLSKSYLSSVLYFDASKYLCCELNIFGDGYMGINDTYPGQFALDRIAKCEEISKVKKFGSLLMICPIDSYRIELLVRIIKEHPEENLVELFRTYYTQADYGFENISIPDVVAMYEKAPQAHFDELRKKFKGKKTIKIYRGQGEKSTPVSKSFSWTTDLKIAYFFAVRFAAEEAMIYEAEVSVEDILDSFADRGEGEVLVRPGKAKIVNTIYLPGMSTIASQNVPLDYFDEAKQLYGDEEGAHGYNHICRMLLMLKIVAPVLDLNSAERLILKTAILYHDIGREDDTEDAAHGARSAEIFLKSKGKTKIKDIVAFLVTYHCVEDEKAKKHLQEVKDPVLTLKLYGILKDIDALDRLRFGLKNLDVSYLRNKELMNFVLVSHLLQKFKY